MKEISKEDRPYLEFGHLANSSLCSCWTDVYYLFLCWFKWFKILNVTCTPSSESSDIGRACVLRVIQRCDDRE